MTFQEQIDAITDRDSFVRFVYDLAQDAEDHLGRWENADLSQYLSALGSWTQNMDGYFLNRKLPVPQEPSWQLFAHILMAASMYE